VESERNDRRIDWIGGLLFTAGAVFLFFCLSQGLSEPKGFGTPCKPLSLRRVRVHRLISSQRYYRSLGRELCAIDICSNMGSPPGEENIFPANYENQYCNEESLSGGSRLLRGRKYKRGRCGKEAYQITSA
jgi:hypothetical protein